MAHSFLATTNITRATFVKLSTTVGYVAPCGANERAYGIAMKGTRRSPYIISTDYAAAVDEPLQVHDEPGEECSLVLGGTVAAGDYIKSHSDGTGLASTTDLDDIGAIAMQGGASGDIIKVQIHRMERSV